MSKLWTCTEFSGHYPVPVAAVVCAETKEEASNLLNTELKKIGLKGDSEPEGMQLVSGSKPGNIFILSSGDY